MVEKLKEDSELRRENEEANLDGEAGKDHGQENKKRIAGD